MSPVSFGPSDITNPRGTPFSGMVPESFWLTKALLFDFEWVMAESQNSHYYKKDYEDPSPLTALKDCLRTLRSYEIRLALTSNRKSEEIIPVLREMGLAQEFDNIRCADDVKNPKPAPDMYQLSMEMLGIKPWRAAAFETSEEGVQGAKAAGLFCVGLPSMNGLVDYHLKSFLEHPLIHMLEQMDRAKRKKLTSLK